MICLLTICLGITALSNGILLIDGLESGFHYSMYGRLWEILDLLPRQSDCQIVATTQSIELIQSAAEFHLDPEDLCYFRLGYGRDGYYAYRFDASSLSGALNSDLEVR